MMPRRPLIGITADIEVRDGNPPRDWYFLDAQNIPALEAAGALPVILPHAIDLIDDYLDRLDGVLISGGGYQYPDPALVDWDSAEGEPPEKLARARFELALVRRTEARRMPLLGTCGGFQLMNVAAGGSIVPVLPETVHRWRDSASEAVWRFDEPAHDVQATPGSRLATIVGVAPFAVNSRHKQGVHRAAPSVVTSALAPDARGGYERPDLPFWHAVQWHPDFTSRPPTPDLSRAFVAPPESIDDATVHRGHQHRDQQLLATAYWSVHFLDRRRGQLAGGRCCRSGGGARVDACARTMALAHPVPSPLLRYTKRCATGCWPRSRRRCRSISFCSTCTVAWSLRTMMIRRAIC